ncbi:MAG: hypothetical protein JWM82_3977, partial [Myxococcales bacterium]|nr:hypothetical protein [Myxococcales bacterium]
FEETLEVASGDESAVSNGRMILNLGDGKLVGEWEGVVRLGPGYYDAYVRPSPVNVPVKREVRAQMTLRFETSNQKYKWLTEQLCAGFGTFTLEAVDDAGKLAKVPTSLTLDKFTHATFDIYGLT